MNKLLFVAISMPEYRIRFFKGIASKIQTDFCCLDIDGARRTYGIDTKSQLMELSVIVPEGQDAVADILTNGGYTHVVIPSVDTTDLYKMDCRLLDIAQKKEIKTVYWSENWIASSSTMSLKKRLRTCVRKLLIGRIARRCDVCVAAGSKAADFFMKIGVNEGKVKIAYDSSSNPSEPNLDVRTMHGIKENEKIILYLGRLIERKGLHLLIEAVGMMHENDRPLILIGGGYNEYSERCKEKADTIGVKTIFAGLIPPADRASYFNQADVFVLPSYFLDGQIEAWGLTVNECLETGTPVVATTAVGAAYDLLNGKNGVMVQENNVAELKKGISQTLKFGEDNKKECLLTAKKFSSENMASSFCSAME